MCVLFVIDTIIKANLFQTGQEVSSKSDIGDRTCKCSIASNLCITWKKYKLLRNVNNNVYYSLFPFKKDLLLN